MRVRLTCFPVGTLLNGAQRLAVIGGKKVMRWAADDLTADAADRGENVPTYISVIGEPERLGGSNYK